MRKEKIRDFITKKQRLRELLNLLSFKLDQNDYVAAFSLIYRKKNGNSSSEEMIEIFKEVFSHRI